MLVGHEQSQLESSNMEICWQKKLTAETPHFRLLFLDAGKMVFSPQDVTTPTQRKPILIIVTPKPRAVA